MIDAGIQLDSAKQIQSGLQVDEVLRVGGQSLRTTSDLCDPSGDYPSVNRPPAQTQFTPIRFASVLGVHKLSVKLDSIGKEFGYRHSVLSGSDSCCRTEWYPKRANGLPEHGSQFRMLSRARKGG